jgi:hypothetical protein
MLTPYIYPPSKTIYYYFFQSMIPSSQDSDAINQKN